MYQYRYIVIGVMVALCLGGGVYGFAYASAVSGPYVMSLTLHGVHLPGSPCLCGVCHHGRAHATSHHGWAALPSHVDVDGSG